MFDRLVKILASPAFALTCIIAGAGLAGLALFPLQFLGIPSDQIAGLAHRGVPFVAVYVLLAISVIACFRKRIRALPKLIGRSPRLPNRDNEFLSERPYDPVRAKEALERAGFRRVTAETDRAFAVRFAIGPLGNYLLHGAILTAVAAVAVSQIPGADFAGRVRVTQGARFESGRARFSETREKSPRSVPQLPGFSVARVDGTSVGQRPATLVVVVRDERGLVHRITAGWPWVADPLTVVAAEDFGTSVRFSIVPSGTVTPVATGTVDLTAHGSDTTEYFEVNARTGSSYRLGIRAAARPEKSDSKTPLAVSIAESQTSPAGWKLIATSDSMRPADVLKSDTVWLRIEETRPHAVLRVHRSWTAPLALLTLLGAAIGSFLRLAMPRTEAVVERRGDGAVLKVASDIYRTASHAQRELIDAWEEDR